MIMMTNLYPLTILAAAIASSAHASPDPFQAEWGVLADMAGKDFGHGGGSVLYPAKPLAVRWEIPGQSLTMTEWLDKSWFERCTYHRISPQRFSGTCEMSDGSHPWRDEDTSLSLRPDGSVEITRYLRSAVIGGKERRIYTRSGDQFTRKISGTQEPLRPISSVKMKSWTAEVIAALPAPKPPPSPSFAAERDRAKGPPPPPVEEAPPLPPI